MIFSFLSGFHPFTAYYGTRSTDGCLLFIIFGIGLVIWSFFKAFQMTIEEKRLKKKEEQQNNPDFSEMTSSWGKVKVKSKKRRRRRHSHKDDGEYYQAPF